MCMQVDIRQKRMTTRSDAGVHDIATNARGKMRVDANKYERRVQR